MQMNILSNVLPIFPPNVIEEAGAQEMWAGLAGSVSVWPGCARHSSTWLHGHGEALI